MIGMFSDNSSIIGASILHGAHHDAKKLIAKILPLKLDKFKFIFS
jgi:hypothetical protein